MSRPLGALLAILILWTAGAAQVTSLAHLYAPGRGLRDDDGDGRPERIALAIVIPDEPSAAEAALAADIAARANLESLAADYGLVRRESEAGPWQDLAHPILIGSVRWLREAAAAESIVLDGLGPDEGVVFTFSLDGRRGIACAAGSGRALLETGRAYFLRWPYLWEIWGRETGATYEAFEADLGVFLAGEGIDLRSMAIRRARYGFPAAREAKGALQRLDFDGGGQIVALETAVHLAGPADVDKARLALERLRDERPRGLRTGVLSYPACARIDFELRSGSRAARVELPRAGLSKRLLTPGFKADPRVEVPERDFDLLRLFSAEGLYADQDRDGILDGIDAVVVVPPSPPGPALAALAAKLILPAAGGSFPLIALDEEIESRRALTAPVLVGPNALTRDLLRTGKLALPELESGSGVVRIVPRAFNKTNALVFAGADRSGLAKTLDYFARSFPAFAEAREGAPGFADAASDLGKLIKGGLGGAEAWMLGRLRAFLEEARTLALERVDVRLTLPAPNPAFEAFAGRTLRDGLAIKAVTLETSIAREGRPVFEKTGEFSWEAEDALAMIRDKAGSLQSPVRISAGLSESPAVRAGIAARIAEILAGAGSGPAEVEVLSAYKPGFFWLTERILPRLRGRPVARLLVRCAREEDDPARPKRFYAEPSRRLQELYPVDEILARDLGLPLDRISFELRPAPAPAYEVLAMDEREEVLLRAEFSPSDREMPYLNVLPEWGTARVQTGWLRLESAGRVVLDATLQTDLEKLWVFYQEEVLRPLYAHVLKKTGQQPTFSKQPYFKRLLIDVRLSEPDFKLGVDEEIASALEAMHDEIYFDTLDFLRGITAADPDDKEVPEDSSRSSAPGNVLPVIHPSSEGTGGRVRAVLEDWTAASPEIEIRWHEPGRGEKTRRESFPGLKTKGARAEGFLFDGRSGRLRSLDFGLEAEREADYLAAIDLLEGRRELAEAGALPDGGFRYPNVESLAVEVRWQNLRKAERLSVTEPEAVPPGSPGPAEAVEAAPVPTDEIIGPDRCLEIADRLGALPAVRSYVGGRSYEDRDVPVLEAYLPAGPDVSIARLITFKPVLQLSARQHANEVSATNYGLRFIELLATDAAYGEALRKVAVVLQPMENPDGAALAMGLLEHEPFHSLHAGRYGALGMDIGYQTGANRDLLPEAGVRAALQAKWLPDIYLNLHGYPSHEWVQPFSGYVPFLFRDYWIPKGWFAFLRAPRLPLYEPQAKAADAIMDFIAREMRSDERIDASNRRLYDRFQRWAGRWQPHLNFLELHEGVNLYAKRRGPAETRLSARGRMTFAEQTTEVMDETARGDWLAFICEQGLAYLRAHVKYLAGAAGEVVRIEEESRDRVRISFHRVRPGRSEAAERSGGRAGGAGAGGGRRHCLDEENLLR